MNHRWTVDQVSATLRPELGARSPYGWGPPSLSRAQPSRRGPAEIDPIVPSAKTASSDKVRGDRPLSTVDMIAGHASSVEPNRPSTLLEGMSRSWYATAPSMKISVFSPGLRAKGFGTNSTVEKSISGMKNSSSGSSFVFTSFALRGAPCGDHPRLWAAFGRYHEQEEPPTRVADRDESIVVAIVSGIRPSASVGVEIHCCCFVERHPVFREVDARLLEIPYVAPGHRGTIDSASSPGLIAC